MRAVLLASFDHVSSQTHVADTPGNRALLARRRRLVRLAFDAEVHDVVAANGAVVDDDIPCPESYSIPLTAC